ncbi:hypothetical protein ES705_34817 [subsurface metagenome]
MTRTQIVGSIKEYMDKAEEYLLRVLTDDQIIQEDKARLEGETFNVLPYEKMIKRDLSFIADELGRFWLYDTEYNIWRTKGEIYLRHYLRNRYLIKKDMRSLCCNEITNHIRDRALLNKEKFDTLFAPPQLIPFNNVIYNMDTEKAMPYDKKYFFTRKLKVKYNPDAPKCEKIDKFFSEIVKEEDVITLYELLAYCMWRLK